jgi:hypothetical protein
MPIASLLITAFLQAALLTAAAAFALPHPALSGWAGKLALAAAAIAVGTPLFAAALLASVRFDRDSCGTAGRCFLITLLPALLLAAFRLRTFEPSPWLWKLYLAEALLLAVLAVVALLPSRRKC